MGVAHHVLHRRQHMKFSPTQDPSGENVVASQRLASQSLTLSPVTREAVKLVKSTRYVNRSINEGQDCFNLEQCSYQPKCPISRAHPTCHQLGLKVWGCDEQLGMQGGEL